MTLKPASLLFALAFGLAACGGQSGTQSPAASGAAAPAAAKPAGKDNVVIDNGAEPESLDPHKSGESASFAIIRQMLMGLVAADAQGNTVPGVAEKWESSDNKVWTFHLRDAKWANGDPVTAEDFVYSLRRLTDPATASPYSSYLSDAKVENAAAIAEGKAKPDTLGVKALDAKTLQFTLTEAVPYFPDMLLLPVTYAVHKATVEKHGEKWTLPENYMPNAAYKLKEWTVNSQIVLERNNAYYDNAKTNINNIVFLPITDAAVGYNRYLADEVDVVPVPPEQFQKVKAERSSEMYSNTNLCTFYYEPNLKNPIFADAKVRKALSLTLDRETIAGKVMGRGETPSYQFTPPSTQGMGEVAVSWKSWDAAKRTEEAKKLLTEAGYSESKPLKFEILYNTSDVGKKLVSAGASMWKTALGNLVDVKMINQEWKTSLETRRNGKFEIALAGWCADYNEPSSFLNMLRANNTNNTGKYIKPEFEALLDKTLSAPDAESRKKLYHEAETMLENDAGLIPVYNRVSVMLVKPHIGNFTNQDPMSNWLVKDWKLN